MQKLLLLILITFSQSALSAQTNRDNLLQEMGKLMLANYIFLDKAEETNAHLDALMEKKFFDSFTEPEAFAKAVTEEMRKITHDKHLGMTAPRVPVENSSEEADEPLENLVRYAQPMINEIKCLEHNIGYFDMRYFGGAERHYSDVDQVMNRLATADALIIDMRYNGGGSPQMAQYLTSYFFNTRFLLNTIYERATDHSREMWTVDVEGVKRPDVPVFILTSKRTFSGAEDFSYTMQQHKHRATIVGETTGGGAHPTRYFPLKEGYGVRIPFARTINPVTETNWEGVGVIPDIKCTADDAFDKALELAEAAAQEYKLSFFDPLIEALEKTEGKKLNEADSKAIYELFKSAVDANFMTEDDINLAGYGYLNQGRLNPALAIFSSNTVLFPNSVNVFDSYAEGLAMDGQNALALENYEKAVALAVEQNHRSLEIYQENLRTFKERTK